MSQRKRDKDRPFYAPPPIRTGADVIREARNSLRFIKAERPESRNFECQSRQIESQSSDFSANSYAESRPSSGAFGLPLPNRQPSAGSAAVLHKRLDPLNETENEYISKSKPQKSKSPANSLARSSSFSENGASQVSSDCISSDCISGRRVHSGPKDRRTPSGSVAREPTLSSLVKRCDSGISSQAVSAATDRSSCLSPLLLTSDEIQTCHESHRKTMSPEKLATNDKEKPVNTPKTSAKPKKVSKTAKTANESSSGGNSATLTTQVSSPTDHNSDAPASPMSTGTASEVDVALAILQREQDSLVLSKTAEDLLIFLHKSNLLGKRCPDRTRILQALFKLLEAESLQLQLILFTLILSLNVSGKNLVSVCRVIFRLSRIEKHEKQIVSCEYALDSKNVTGVLPLLLKLACQRLSPPKEGLLESLVYVVGSLKSFAVKTPTALIVLKKDPISSLKKLMQNCFDHLVEYSTAKHHCSNLMVQLIGCLRNFADHGSEVRTTLAKSETLTLLAKCMNHMPNDADLVLNCCRLLSKLSSYPELCRQNLTPVPSIPSTLTSMLALHHVHSDIVVRIVFILSNIVVCEEDENAAISHDEETRDPAKFVFSSNENFVDTLTSALKYETTTFIKLFNKVAANSEKQEKTQLDKIVKLLDCLKKILSLVANLSANHEVGSQLSTSKSLSAVLIDLFEMTLCLNGYQPASVVCNPFSSVPPDATLFATMNDANNATDLLSHCLVTLGNLSFYHATSSSSSSSSLFSGANAARMCGPFSELLLFDADILGRPKSKSKSTINPSTTETFKIEVLSCLANISLHNENKAPLVSGRVVEICTAYLNSSRSELVYWSTGILINVLSSEVESVRMFDGEDGLGKLSDAINEYSCSDDTELAIALCQLIANRLQWIEQIPFHDVQSAVHLYDQLLTLSELHVDSTDPSGDAIFEISNTILDRLEPLLVEVPAASNVLQALPYDGPEESVPVEGGSSEVVHPSSSVQSSEKPSVKPPHKRRSSLTKRTHQPVVATTPNASKQTPPRASLPPKPPRTPPRTGGTSKQ